MSSLDELIAKARHLLSEGHSPGQIADELSLSQETVTWLLTQKKGDAAPKDVSIDWTVVSGNALLLDDVARLMLDRYHCGAPSGETALARRGRDRRDRALRVSRSRP